VQRQRGQCQAQQRARRRQRHGRRREVPQVDEARADHHFETAAFEMHQPVHDVVEDAADTRRAENAKHIAVAGREATDEIELETPVEAGIAGHRHAVEIDAGVRTAEFDLEQAQRIEIQVAAKGQQPGRTAGRDGHAFGERGFHQLDPSIAGNHTTVHDGRRARRDGHCQAR
jgi:hypothetical protein